MASRRRPVPGAGRLVRRAELAAVLGISVRLVSQLEADRVLTPARRGKGGRASEFSLADSVQAYIASRVEQRRTEGISYDIERAEIARQRRIQLERENAEASGRLVSRDEVVRGGQAFTRGLLAELRSLPRRAAFAGVIPAEQVPALARLCRELQQRVCQWRSVADVELNIARLEEPL